MRAGRGDRDDSLSLLPSLWERQPDAGKDIAQREAEHDHEPEKPGSNKELDELTVLTHVHEEQDDEQGFGCGDAERHYIIECSKDP